MATAHGAPELLEGMDRDAVAEGICRHFLAARRWGFYFPYVHSVLSQLGNHGLCSERLRALYNSGALSIDRPLSLVELATRKVASLSDKDLGLGENADLSHYISEECAYRLDAAIICSREGCGRMCYECIGRDMIKDGGYFLGGVCSEACLRGMEPGMAGG